MITTWLALQLLAGGSAFPAARAPARRFTAEAPIRRGRVRRARWRATQRALLDAVWQRLEPWVAPSQRTPKLRQALARRVRRLIARYRTKKKKRVDGKLRVTLAVTVDDKALRARLTQLGVRILEPGLLLTTRCAAGDPEPALRTALRATGVRLHRDAGAKATGARGPSTARATAGAALARARALRAHGALVVTCRSVASSPLPGVSRQGGQVALTASLYRVGAPRGPVFTVTATGAGFGADAGTASRAALRHATRALGPQLGETLTRRLPSGPVRRLRLRLRGGLPLSRQLALAPQLRRQLPGVREVTPHRFARGETWFSLRTVHDLGALKGALARATLPEGWIWQVQVVRPAGFIDLRATLEEP